MSEIPKLAGVLVHECQHVLRDLKRLDRVVKMFMDKGMPKEKAQNLANIVGDWAINYDLKRAGWELPSWGCFAEDAGMPTGKTMEWYAKELLKNPDKQKQAQQSASNKVTGGSCGEVGGHSDEKLEEAFEKARAEGKGRKKEEIKNAKESTTSAADEHFKGVGAGDKPDWLEEALDAIKNQRPERNWEKECQYVIRRTSGVIQQGRADYSLRRPSKRSYIVGIPKPGLVDYKPVVGIYWDTSGSMSDSDVLAAKRSTLDVLRQMGLHDVWVAQGDAGVSMEFKKCRINEVQSMKRHGMGGTDFRPLFKAVEKGKPKVDILIVMSDGDGPAPAKPPKGTEVVWLIIPNFSSRVPVPWGKHLVCSNDWQVVDKILASAPKAA